MEPYSVFGERVVSTASEDDQRLSGFTPAWDRSPLEQGLEDAEKFLHKTKSLECASMQVRMKGFQIVEHTEQRPFTMFEIEVSTGHSKWVVDRRYRDFYYLHKQLRKHFITTSLPNLPGKRFLGSSTDLGFIEERARHLHDYLCMLVANKEVWTRSDIVKFLDGDSHILMFVWNFERMRKMQQVLGSMNESSRAAELETELQDARDQVKILQDRVARMEMLFLQNAAGVAVDNIPSNTISRLGGSRAEYDHGVGSDAEDEHEGSDGAHSPRPTARDGSHGDSFSSGELFSPLDNMLLSPHDPQSVIRAVSYATGNTSAVRSRSRSEDVSAVRLSLQIREAMTLSNDLLAEPYLTDKLRSELEEVNEENADPDWSSRLTLTLRPSEYQERLMHSLLDLRLTETIPLWLQRTMYHADTVVTWLSPSYRAMEERMRVLEYVRGIVSRALGARLFPVGSFVLRTFLPDGDIDASAFLCLGQEENWFIKVNEALCLCAMSSRVPSGPDRCIVKNVSFINAEVKIVKAVINNISIDVSANQLPAVYSAALFDELDRFISKQYLFKRSALLVKAWCKYDSERYSDSKGAVFGSRDGRLSTLSLNIMLAALFNKRAPTIDSPFQALILFLQAYSTLDWNRYAITAQGPVSAIDLSPVDLDNPELEFWQGPTYIPESLFETYRARFAQACNSSMKEREGLDVGSNEVAWAHGQDHFYRRGLINVMDPVWPTQNVNRSVTVPGATGICTALREAYNSVLERIQQAASEEDGLHRATLMLKSQAATPDAISGADPSVPTADMRNCPLVMQLFASTIDQYARGDGWRPDLGWRTTVSLDEPRNLFDTRSQEFETSMLHAELVLANQITPEALISMVVHVLEMKGPLPVGEIGKQLQEATGNPQLSQVLKEQYGGLKKFIEGISSIVRIGEDHPFNPHVYLPGQIAPSRQENRDQVTAQNTKTNSTSRRTPPTSPQLPPQSGHHQTSSGHVAKQKKSTRSKPRSSSFGTTVPAANRPRQRNSAPRTPGDGGPAFDSEDPNSHIFVMPPTEYLNGVPQSHGVVYTPVIGYSQAGHQPYVLGPPAAYPYPPSPNTPSAPMNSPDHYYQPGP